MKAIYRMAMLVLCSGLLLIPAAAQTSNSSANDAASQTNSGSAKSSSKSNAATNSGKLGASDRQFLKKAAQGGKAEVELGQLAQRKAASDEVKKFGERMVTDHSKANDQLQQLASQKGLTLPDKLNAKDQATKARLEKLSGKQFDQAYMRDMVKDHTKDVNEFQHEANNAKDPDVKSFAQSTLPTLQDHLKEAKQIAPSGTVTASNRSNHK